MNDCYAEPPPLGPPPHVVVPPTTADVLTALVRAGHGYLVEPVCAPTTAQPFTPVAGVPSTVYKTL
ncbi:MAG TPA: hypothetical protein VGZ32_09410 [Actinocrinis sp.]|uniref:hypothetical protein n=1 Tax=Actinocrinis sp. TaxID=1920516 RepID=UPI002DDD1B8C|nr:hypothetical protein [Actinocrinis sp.]HEV3170546.1 hypothetical protein [Actinocrinis sp.]